MGFFYNRVIHFSNKLPYKIRKATVFFKLQSNWMISEIIRKTISESIFGNYKSFNRISYIYIYIYTLY